MDKVLLNPMECAEILSIGRTRIYEMLASGEIGPVIRIGRSIRVPLKTIENWIEERTRQAVEHAGHEE